MAGKLWSPSLHQPPDLSKAWAPHGLRPTKHTGAGEVEHSMNLAARLRP